MTDNIRTSKLLSYWLRHRPDDARIVLNQAGWASVDAVLAALHREQPEMDWDRLLEVVELNDKQRFELSPDAQFIRARQGHSVDITGNWPETAPPDLLFHGTVERFLEAILTQGLKPMRRHHVHLSPDIATAQRVGARRGSPIILKVQASLMAKEGSIFRLTSNGVWLADHVPPAYLSLV